MIGEKKAPTQNAPQKTVISQTQPFVPKELPKSVPPAPAESGEWVKLARGGKPSAGASKKENSSKTEKCAEVNKPDPKFWLVNEGWPVQAYKHYTDIPVGEAGICLVTKMDAPKAMEELKHSTALIALLAPCPIEGKGKKVNVIVEDKDGHRDVRQRFLLHVGKSEVEISYSSDVPTVEAISESTTVIALRFSRNACLPLFSGTHKQHHTRLQETGLQYMPTSDLWTFSEPQSGTTQGRSLSRF